MKRYIKAETSTEFRNWIASEEVEDMMKRMTSEEKRLIGKIANAQDTSSYVHGMIDVIDLFKVKTSETFDDFFATLVEKI